jgi:hypothetical protein
MTVAKLRGARERKRREDGWCEGGAPLHVRYPEAVRNACPPKATWGRSRHNSLLCPEARNMDPRSAFKNDPSIA